jgi:hypothetical protein
MFWLAGWTVGGAFAIAALYRIFRPSVPETFKLGSDGVAYDSGVVPFRHDFTSQKNSWSNYFPKRTAITVSRQDLHSLRLREGEAVNRLTVDVASARVDIARAASEVEREWLYRVLTERYSLPAA